MNRLLESWDYLDTTHQRFYITGSETPTVVSGGRRGTLACSADTEQGYGAYIVATSGNELICGAAVAWPTASGLGNIFAFGDPTASGYVNVFITALDDGSIVIYRYPDTLLALSPAGVLAFGAGYQYIEARVGIASGVSGIAEVRVNGQPVITLSAVNTFYAGSLTPTLVFIYPQGRRIYDDLFINDAMGGVNDSFEGDVRIDTHYPDADGAHSEWNRLSGAIQFEMIDEHPPDEDTTYNFTTTSGNLDTVSVQTLIPVFAGIRAVSLIARARKVPPGNAGLAPIIRFNSVDYEGTGYTLGSGYAYHETNYDTHPATASGWSDSDFNSSEFGYKKVQ